MTGTTKQRERFEAACGDIPPSGGNGCHPYLLKLANLSRGLDLSAKEFIQAVRQYLDDSQRPVYDTEILDAYHKAKSTEIPFRPRRETPEVVEIPPAELGEIMMDSVAQMSPTDQTKQFLKAVFKNRDLIYAGKENIKLKRQDLKTQSDMVDCPPAGPFFCANPLKPEGGTAKDGKHSYRCDDAVADYRYIVVEFDSIGLNEQLGICKELIKLGCVASITFSGGKSYHVLLRIDAGNYEEYQMSVSRIKPLLVELGADQACFNPSRLTRLPGARRREKGNIVQQLIYLNPSSEPNIKGIVERFTEKENDDLLLPENLSQVLPPAQQKVVDLLADCSQTPKDIISLFIQVFCLPFLEGTQLKQTEEACGRSCRLMVTVIGPSGSGKTTPLERLRPLYRDLEQKVDQENQDRKERVRLLRAQLRKTKKDNSSKIAKLQADISKTRPQHKVYQTQTGTRQGLCRAFEDGSHPLIILDEIGSFIRRADRGGPERDNMDCITELADQGIIRPPLFKGTGESEPTKTTHNVSFSLYGTTTKEDLPQKKAAHLLKGGFLARQLIGIIDEVKAPPEKDFLTTTEMDTLIQWRDQIMRACENAGFEFIFSESAQKVLKEYKERIGHEYEIAGNSHEHHAGMIIRKIKQAEDIALIFHATDPDTNTNKLISASTVTMATRFVDYVHIVHHSKFLHFVAEGEKASNRKAIGDRILGHLNRHDGSATLRDIYRNLNLRKNVALEVIGELKKQGLVSAKGTTFSLV
jgi:hypothetical protein